MHTSKTQLLGVSLLVISTLLAFPASAAIMGAEYDYDYGFVEDFDSMGTDTNAPGTGGDTYWSVLMKDPSGNEWAERLKVPTNEWGGSNGGYNAPWTSSDRHLAGYWTDDPLAQGPQEFRARFRNDMGQPLDIIRLVYDFECAWSRLDNSKFRQATLQVEFSTNNFATYQTMGGFGAEVDNSQVTLADDERWLSDSEMDSLSMSVRKVGGSFSPTIDVPAGGTFYIRWRRVVGSGGASPAQNMNFGIDNIRSVGPYIKNYDLVNLTYTTADIVGHLVYTGGAPTTVFCYWGPTDGGDITSGLWGKTNDLGAGAEGTYVTNSADLTLFSEKEFFFRFAATNAYATNWAAASEYFIATNVWIVATDTNVAEEGSDAGTLEVRRPASVTAGNLVVNYTIGGSAVNGTDYGALSGSVTIPAGQTNAVITVTPVDDTIVEEGGETVIITLAPGNYLIGNPNAQTLTIAEDDFIPGSMVYFR